jgi:hypothetical protein
MICYFCEEQTKTIEFKLPVDRGMIIEGDCCEVCYFDYVEGDEL